jgi:hypothetical protein
LLRCSEGIPLESQQNFHTEPLKRSGAIGEDRPGAAWRTDAIGTLGEEVARSDTGRMWADD